LLFVGHNLITGDYMLKALWTTRGPVNFQGKFHTLSGAHIRPRPHQQVPPARPR